MRFRAIAAVGVAAIVAAGCQHRADQSSALIDMSRSTGLSAVRGTGLAAILSAPRKPASGFPAPTEVLAAGKYLAVKHQLTLVGSEAQVGKSLEAVVGFCGSIRCEVLSSSVANKTEGAIAAGSVSVRVAPLDLSKFLEFVGKQGAISQHSTETADKTTQVLDLEAKLKNQTEFRDNLRRMMARPGVTVADLLQIQQKLTDTQSELDSEAAQRAALANETEKVEVEIEFRAEGVARRGSAWSPLGRALEEAGREFALSLAALITVVVAVIPWLIVIVPGGWLVVRGSRNWRRRRTLDRAAA
ncbi:MAG TPA: DUF4349 domain-containing protein [Candidatus Saccharimonadales bacterium]|nr:DUF4349 domain-containing protein [Candidatus Saccharimonadales bacterium]